jgi:carbon-monoxide dehydrogenase medium subunit
MKPPQFTYTCPETLDEALDLLAQHGDDALILAGGQSLMPMLNMRLVRPAVVIDIGRVKNLDQLEIGDGGVRAGATVRQRQLERASGLDRVNPLLRDAMPLIGHFPIRNRGTVCGSLAHADPAAELPAVAMTLDAQFTLASKGGSRVVQANDFFMGYLTTCRQSNEMLVEVKFPARRSGEGWSIQEFARRQGDFAIVGVAVSLRMTNGRCEDVSLDTFGTSGRAERMAAVEDVLRGQSVADSHIDEAVETMRNKLEADDDIHASGEYRAYVAGTLTRRALKEALARARNGSEG